ncbi:MAG: 4-hydroxy-3-methylbut-2-enyl diphosphate reductase 1 [Bacteroidia bacterium]|nr:4-hydroxy-3-methylbut-2-enyl diphosphate reductase 1 [Bacteroidia bacterium]
MKEFNIPAFYRSSVIGAIKQNRKDSDPRKKDFTPTVLDFGPVRFFIARHFGFCYGVENAIEISYRALEENPGKRIFLLSQMIHNPEVNNDLQQRGIKFIMDTEGKQFIPWSELKSDDIVIIPAFGTTLEIEKKLNEIGINPQTYNTTCPFVERVWKKSEKLGQDNHTIIIHGKSNHEETRATFSHSNQTAPTLVVKDIKEAKLLGDIILGKLPVSDFENYFRARSSANFSPEKDLARIGVVNQTTMLATETQEIADYLKNIMLLKFGEADLKKHFADTRDTLCYATNDNQQATYGLLEQDADLAIVVGGYNSSNTSHLVELCERKFPTYFISSDREIISQTDIRHCNFHTHELKISQNYLPQKEKLSIVLTSGASCPDAIVDAVLKKLLSYFKEVRPLEEVVEEALG